MSNCKHIHVVGVSTGLDIFCSCLLLSVHMHILHSDRDVADYTVSEANVNFLLLCQEHISI